MNAREPDDRDCVNIGYKEQGEPTTWKPGGAHLVRITIQGKEGKGAAGRGAATQR